MEEELHKDISICLPMLKLKIESDEKKGNTDEPAKHNLGYIQMASLNPVLVICFGWKQLRLLRNLISSDPNVCIHVDSTSNIVSRLSPPLCTEKLDIYILSIASNLTGVEPVIISEMITSDTSMPPICFFLTLLLHRYFYSHLT